MSESLERPQGTLTLKPKVAFEPVTCAIHPYNPEGLELITVDSVQAALGLALLNRDFDYMANLLACTLPGLDMGARSMVVAVFTLPELQPYHQQLWEKIKPDITPGFQDEIYDFVMRDCEWEV